MTPQQLPSGRHGLDRVFVRDNQRRRLLAAAMAYIEQYGVEAMRVTDVVSGARCSRKVFYQHFGNIDECADVAWDQLVMSYIEAAPPEEAAVWGALRDAAVTMAKGGVVLPPLRGVPRDALAAIMGALGREGLAIVRQP